MTFIKARNLVNVSTSQEGLFCRGGTAVKSPRRDLLGFRGGLSCRGGTAVISMGPTAAMLTIDVGT